MQNMKRWSFLVLKIFVCYYVAGTAILIPDLYLHYQPHAHVHLGMLWLVMPIIHPYDFVLKPLLEGKPPYADSVGIAEQVWMLLLFVLVFFFVFRLLTRIFATQPEELKGPG